MRNTVHNSWDVKMIMKYCGWWDEKLLSLQLLVLHLYTDQKFIIMMPIDVLAPDGAGWSANILLSSILCDYLWFCTHFQWWGDFIQNGSSDFTALNTWRPRQNGRHFADNVFKCIYLNENVWILLKISLKFVPKGPVNNIPSLVQVMAWCRPGNKPLSEPMMVSLLTHICVAWPQWVKDIHPLYGLMHPYHH